MWKVKRVSAGIKCFKVKYIYISFHTLCLIVCRQVIYDFSIEIIFLIECYPMIIHINVFCFIVFFMAKFNGKYLIVGIHTGLVLHFISF